MKSIAGAPVMKRTLVVLAALLAAPSVLAADDAAYTEETWRADLAAEAARARATHPEAGERLARLEGLTPAVYLLRRRPEPEVERELSQLLRRQEVPAALLAELFLSGLAEHRFSTPQSFPKKHKGEAAALVQLEKTQLRDGLLLALSASGHPAAPYVLREALAADAPLEQRAVAAFGIGRTQGPLALEVLAPLVSDPKTDFTLRASALQGIAAQRSLKALELLESHALLAASPDAQRAVALSLASLGSSWAHAKAGDEGELLRQRASLALVALLARTDDAEAARACIDAIGVVAHPAAKAPLAALVADKSTAPAVKERAQRASRRLERALRRAAR
jgi:hypothetical protein